MTEDKNLQLKTLLLSFREVHQKTRHILNAAAMEKEITIVQLLIADIIKHSPGIHSQDVAKEMKLAKSTVSGTINRMVTAGFITTTEHPQDKRCHQLYVTECGLKKIRETYDIYLENLSSLLDIGPEKMKTLLSIHDDLLTKIDEVTI